MEQIEQEKVLAVGQESDPSAAASAAADHNGADSEADQLIGAVLDRRYQLTSMIAPDRIGTIFKATDLLSSETVAVKILNDTIDDTEIQLQIQQSAAEIRGFSHANVLPVLDLGLTPDHHPYFVSPPFAGLSLSQCISDQQSLSEDDILDIFPQVVDALVKIHEAQVVYRGLQPGSIVLTAAANEEVRVMLLDYGPAKLLNGATAGALAQTGEFFVSPLHASPEQCLKKTVGMQADIYSLGCVIYEAITGTPPHAAGTLDEIAIKHISEKPPSISDCKLKHHIPASLIRIVDKAMEKDLEKRFKKMSELRQELNRHKMGMTLRKIPPPPAPPPMEKRKGRRRSRFNKPIPIALLTLLFFLIAAVMMIQ